MIHIRYRTLPPGMHAEAERGRRGVVVYLLPGLTTAQRGAALRRLRQEGSRGCGPRLPPGQLAVALAADRLRVGARNAGAAIRRHPVGTLLPALLTAGLLAVFVLTSLSGPVVPALAPGKGGAANWPEPGGTPWREDVPAFTPHGSPGFGGTVVRPTMIRPTRP